VPARPTTRRVQKPKAEKAIALQEGWYLLWERMRCERCLLLDPASAELPLEVFTGRLAECDRCDLVSEGSSSLPIRTLVRKLHESARALRKLELKASKWENSHQELAAELKRYEERVEILEGIQRASTQETEAELRAKIGVVERQRLAIMALSVPIIQVGEGVLALPVIGAIDTERAVLMTTNLLEKIQSTGSKYAIIDLTGVLAIDDVTMYHLLRLFRVVRLLGAEIIVTGVQKKVAQSMVGLQVDLSAIRVMGDLKDALRACRA
jgi:anti-anti-sigma regulatory factor